jgi:hypothetical protein
MQNHNALPSNFAQIPALSKASVQLLSPLDIERINMLLPCASRLNPAMAAGDSN